MFDIKYGKLTPMQKDPKFIKLKANPFPQFDRMLYIMQERGQLVPTLVPTTATMTTSPILHSVLPLRSIMVSLIPCLQVVELLTVPAPRNFWNVPISVRGRRGTNEGRMRMRVTMVRMRMTKSPLKRGKQTRGAAEEEEHAR